MKGARRYLAKQVDCKAFILVFLSMLIILVIRHNVPRLLNLLLELSHANNLKYTLNAKVFRIVLLGAEALFSSLLLVIITYIKFYCVSGELKGRRINRKALTKQTNNEPSIVWEKAPTEKAFPNEQIVPLTATFRHCTRQLISIEIAFPSLGKTTFPSIYGWNTWSILP